MLKHRHSNFKTHYLQKVNPLNTFFLHFRLLLTIVRVYKLYLLTYLLFAKKLLSKRARTHGNQQHCLDDAAAANNYENSFEVIFTTAD